MRSHVKQILKIFFITLTFFLIIDLFLGNYLYKNFLRVNYFDRDTIMGEPQPVFHHTSKKIIKLFRQDGGIENLLTVQIILVLEISAML